MNRTYKSYFNKILCIVLMLFILYIIMSLVKIILTNTYIPSIDQLQNIHPALIGYI